jgi:hypothetical protein
MKETKHKQGGQLLDRTPPPSFPLAAAVPDKFIHKKIEKLSNPFLLKPSSSTANLPRVGPINKLTHHLTNFRLVTATAASRISMATSINKLL